MKWIDVKNKLPETSGRFLVSGGEGQAEIFVYVKFSEGGGKFQHKGHDYNDRVTHWLPIPENKLTPE